MLMISAQNPGFSAQSPGFSGSSPGQYFLRVLISISPGHVLPNTCSPVQIHAQPIFSYITLITLAFYIYIQYGKVVLPSGWHHQILGASHVDNGLLQASLPGDIQVYDQQYMMNQVYCNACYDQQVIFVLMLFMQLRNTYPFTKYILKIKTFIPKAKINIFQKYVLFRVVTA